MARKRYVIMVISDDGLLKYAENKWGDALCRYGVDKEEALEIIDNNEDDYREYIIMPVYRSGT